MSLEQTSSLRVDQVRREFTIITSALGELSLGEVNGGLSVDDQTGPDYNDKTGKFILGYN